MLSTEEGLGKGFRSGEVLGGHVLLCGHCSSVVHWWCCIQGVADLDGRLRFLDHFCLCREGSWHNILFLDGAHISLNLAIDLRIKLSLSRISCIIWCLYVRCELFKAKSRSPYSLKITNQITVSQICFCKAPHSLLYHSKGFLPKQLTSSLYWGISAGSLFCAWPWLASQAVP